MDNDTELMLRVGKGDALAFVTLYQKYLPQVARYLTGVDSGATSAEDVAHEVFLRLWARRTEFRGRSEFGTYFWAHVRRVLLEGWRLRAKEQTLASRLLRNCWRKDDSDTPEASACYAETSLLLQQAILRLTADEAEALRLYYDERMLVREAAAFIGCTRTCLESRLLRARRKLRGFIRDGLHPSKLGILQGGR